MAHKVFVDLDDEIVFVVEKVLHSEDNQVLLVVPESAMLVSSLVSLKLLARQINRSKKLAVLATEDKLGLELAEKSGLVAVEKISEVTGKVWKRALLLKEEFLNAREALKRKLVNVRQVGEKSIVEEGTEETVASTEQEIEQSEEVESADPEVADTSEEPEDYFQGMPDKPRIPGKLVNAGGFSMFAGGDIAENTEILEKESLQAGSFDGNEETQVESEKEDSMDEEPQKERASREEKVEKVERKESYEEEMHAEPTRKIIDQRSSFIGKDVAAVESAPRRTRSGGTTGGGENPMEKVIAFFKSDKKRIYFAVGGIFVLILLLLGYFVLPQAKITITLAEAEVPVNEEVKAINGATEIDFEGFAIPATKLELLKSNSGEVATTGKGKTGDKAKGEVDIYNNTEKDVVLPAKTPVVSVSTSKEYVTTKDVTVPKAAPGGGTGRVEDVPIEAKTFGDEYNVDSDTDGVYKIGSYTTGDVNGQTFRDIVGGSSKEVAEVSNDDYNNLQKKLEEELQKSLFAELEKGIKDGMIKIPGTEATTKPTVKPSHEIEEDTANLDMTVEITGSFFVVDEEDLKDMANHLIKEEKELQGDFEVQDLDEIEVSNGSLKGEEATFNLKVKGNIKAQIDEQSIKDQIKGREYSQAAGIIRDLPDVDDFEIDYSPSWMPIKRMPTKDDKIKVVIK